MFEQKDNPYTDDSSIQTVELSLNGIWTIRLPIYSILGTATLIKNKFRNNIEDCDIACFGCSFTYGSYVDYNETWPYLLEKELNKIQKLNPDVTGSIVTDAGGTIGAAGTATSVAGITFYVGQSGSIYTSDVSGTDDSAENNTAFGAAALDAITTGDNNTLIGQNAGHSGTNNFCLLYTSDAADE